MSPGQPVDHTHLASARDLQEQVAHSMLHCAGTERVFTSDAEFKKVVAAAYQLPHEVRQLCTVSTRNTFMIVREKWADLSLSVSVSLSLSLSLSLCLTHLFLFLLFTAVQTVTRPRRGSKVTGHVVCRSDTCALQGHLGCGTTSCTAGTVLNLSAH